jgi:hypothetical protein
MATLYGQDDTILSLRHIPYASSLHAIHPTAVRQPLLPSTITVTLRPAVLRVWIWRGLPEQLLRLHAHPRVLDRRVGAEQIQTMRH